MSIRDRIRELRRVRASELIPHPKNWRRHPPAQRAALAELLNQIGYADALLARETEDGRLQLIDGHLRAETTPDTVVPVLVLELSEQEAELLLATLDPLAAMAETDTGLLAELVGRLEVEGEQVEQWLSHTTRDALPPPPEEDSPSRPIALRDVYQLIVDCDDEAQQRSLYERLAGEGWKCRVVVVAGYERSPTNPLRKGGAECA